MQNPANQIPQALTGPATITVVAPGRINIIGEHTDYNGGLVLPASIDKHLVFAARPFEGDAWQLTAVDIDQTATLSLPVDQPTDKQWVNYLAGIGREFQRLGYTLPGLEIAVGGNLPSGAGMSSSAALEGGLAYLLNEVLDAGLTGPELAQLCKRSSNGFMGIPSGIMDQFASLNGSADGPILLNCETLEFRPVTNNIEGYSFLLVNSLVTHDLADSEYPVRVRQCNEVLAALRKHNPTLDSLSGASVPDLDAVADQVDPVSLGRARYVLAEGLRTHLMTVALERGNAAAATKLLNQTHAGLRDEYEVSCPEVDFLQERASSNFASTCVRAGKEEIYVGSRIMGGGFGGCTINLLPTDKIEAFSSYITQAYEEQYGKTPEIYPVKLARGTHHL